MSYVHKYTPPQSKEKPTELLESGWYDFEVIDSYETNQDGEPLVTKDGDPFVKIRALEAGSGIILYHHLFFSEGGAARLNAFLHATGAQAEEGEELVISANDFVGKFFRGKVEITTRNGREYNQIGYVRPCEAVQPAAEEQPEPSDEDQVPF
jgi:hypothetical protein